MRLEGPERTDQIQEALRVLGVAEKPSKKIIARAFRSAAMKVHPDKNNSPDATEKFKALSNANDLLGLYAEEEILKALPQPLPRKRAHEFFSAGSVAVDEQDFTPDNGWFVDSSFGQDNPNFTITNREYHFCQNSIILWSSGPITLPMKGSDAFNQAMYKKLFPFILLDGRWSHSHVEELVYPRDSKSYEPVLKIIFAEYKIPYSLQEAVCKRFGAQMLLLNIPKQKQLKSTTIFSLANSSQAFFLLNAADSEDKVIAPVGWYLDTTFSMDDTHLKLRNPEYDNFAQDGVVFWYVGSVAPAVSITLQDSSGRFRSGMKQKILSHLPSGNESACGSVELVVKFDMPRDQAVYKTVLSIIFAEFSIPDELQNTILHKTDFQNLPVPDTIIEPPSGMSQSKTQ